MSDNRQTGNDLSGRGDLSLDMNDPRDRGLVNSAMRAWPKRWRGLSPEFKDKLVAGLANANETAQAMLSDPDRGLEAVKAVAQIAAVAVRMEGQEQADQHHRDNLEVAKANAVSNAVSAGLTKVYKGLDPKRIRGETDG